MNRAVRARTRAAGFVGLLLATPASAQVVRPVLSLPRGPVSNVTMDDAGSVIYAVTSTNQFGTNPGYLKQIVRWDPLTGAGTPITSFEEGVDSVSVSDDGAWLAFVSCADPLGTNHDESAELFVMHPDGTGLTQLTSETFLVPGNRGVRAAVISGSGNRVVFVGRVNPLGTNSAYASALFVIDRDGTNLRQLQTDVGLPQEIRPPYYWPGPFLGLDVSDDGYRIVFTRSTGTIGGVNADGTGNQTFGASSAASVAISGNGLRIAFAIGDSIRTVRTQNFDRTTPIVTLGTGDSPSITDDAAQVYYSSSSSAGTLIGISRAASTGGPSTLIAPGLSVVSLSGDGSRLAALDTELRALDNAGGSQRQLTTTGLVSGGPFTDMTFSSDATAISFSSVFDPLGSNAAHDYEQFTYAFPAGPYTQLTDGTFARINDPAFSDTGNLYFVSADPITGENTCFLPQLYSRAPNGWTTRLTACGVGTVGDVKPAPRADGATIAFVGSTPQGSWNQVNAINFDGAGRREVASMATSCTGLFAAGSGGTTWVTFVSGVNGGYVWRVNGDGTGLQPVSFPAAATRRPSISDDGNRVAWESRLAVGIDPNAPPPFQTYLLDVPSGVFHQLTNASVGDDTFYSRVTRNGAWVFTKDGRYDASTFAFDPAAGFPHSGAQTFQLQPDATGNRWLVAVSDPALQSFYLADMSLVPAFNVGKTSPTELSWDPSPTSLRYDVIRGSISNLSIAGSTVSLGPVSCLEDDSPDSHTRGYGDPVEPAPGEAFFFLYRGSVGASAAAGSYGQGTGGRERIAGSGGCNP